jgi:hypothetical protein
MGIGTLDHDGFTVDNEQLLARGYSLTARQPSSDFQVGDLAVCPRIISRALLVMQPEMVMGASAVSGLAFHGYRAVSRVSIACSTSDIGLHGDAGFVAIKSDGAATPRPGDDGLRHGAGDRPGHDQHARDPV